TLKALSDLDLHLARDQEQDEKVKSLESQVQQLEQRLQNIELMLQDRLNVEGGSARVVSPQASAAPARPTAVPVVSAPLVLSGKVKGAKAQAKKSPKAKQQRYAER
ncbi:MAG: hypothetical protein JST92_14805, partial [Deltaproteobacteria bacterium]|nr:hypothetical protein [Deltaproteobacteria bacterium]